MRRNKIILTLVLMLSSLIFTIISCKSGSNLPPGTHCVGVIEVIQTSNYTYLQVEENDNKFWIAVVRREAKSGDVIYYTKAGEMKNFFSKELGRTFPSVFFVEDPSDKLITAESPTPQNFSSRKNEIKRQSGISVEPVKGGITISDLYKMQADYAGKAVIIRGVVVKYNKQIMNKNWIHIQDGTENSGKFDLTVTSMDSVQVGNTVTFKGIIRLNKDFGAGYVYDVIMEEATASDIIPTK
jgi:GW (Gly-Tryp) dipeptide domain